MKEGMGLDFRMILASAALILGLWSFGSYLLQHTPMAFGGNFGSMAQQQMGRYQIAAKDANSAWVIDTAAGDIFLFYANGKWKDVGSIFDEKNRIRDRSRSRD